MRACASLAVALLLPCLAHAEGAASDAPRAPGASVVVDLVAAPGTPAWIASAFEQGITRELAGFERIAVVVKTDLEVHTCGTETGCRLGVYRRAGIDVVLFGQVTGGEIAYELYQTWTPARLETGTIEIGRAQSLVGLQHATRNAFHPVLKHGGLLDQRPYVFDSAATATTERARWSQRELAIFGVAVALFALPFGFVAVRGRARAIPAMRSVRWIGGGVAAGAVVVIALGPRDVVELVQAWPWALAGLGGLGWGVFVVGCFRAAFPPLDGLERIAQQDLVRTLRTWFLACGERLVGLAILYAPIGLLVAWLGRALAIPDLWTVFLIAPGFALVARLWYAAWVECLAVLLDRRLVIGPASADNPWSREISDYLVGYVRRTGWDLDPALLASVQFFPGKGVGGVVAYGGGTTHARIVIDLPLLELALGALVEVKLDEKPALWPDWTAAVVVPQPARRPRRAATSAEDFRGRKPRVYPGVQRKPLGQAATLLGHVLPAPGQVVPLISDNPQDLAVVRELLSEHYPWFAPDPDDEFDATDPTDKDLLFGALARELGAVRRGETQLATVKLALGRRVAALSSRYRPRIADSYAAINYARHHLIQYLHYQWTRRDDHLTTRARPDRLAETSRTIFRALGTTTPAPNREIRTRLVWLSAFFAEPIELRHRRAIRRVLGIAVAAGLVTAAGIAVKRSVDYHAVYTERITAQERALAEARLREAAQHQAKGVPDGETKKE